MLLILNETCDLRTRRRFIRGLVLLVVRFPITSRRDLTLRRCLGLNRVITCRYEAETSGVGSAVYRASAQTGLREADSGIGINVSVILLRRITRSIEVENDGLLTVGPFRS